MAITQGRGELRDQPTAQRKLTAHRKGHPPTGGTKSSVRA
ncbi:hypothetical protein SBRY_60053 [Actinacidiphila bryophytorum]|uniref:Uncharacterized protein n=1 Tax=Actinacidiphila bryophytorum TaxID=1436133 RepID=A0A9W4MJT5_9ACTN|nr:hypothetical protein SBRY_60053 [Actinacidiphila bryophytorum]